MAGKSHSRFVRDCALGSVSGVPVEPSDIAPMAEVLRLRVDQLVPLAASLNDCARVANTTCMVPSESEDLARHVAQDASEISGILDDYLVVRRESETDTATAGHVGARAKLPQLGGRRVVHVELRPSEREILKAKANNQGVSLSRLLLEGALCDPDKRVPRTTTLALYREVHALTLQLFGCVTNLRQLASWTVVGSDTRRQLDDCELEVFRVAFRLRELRSELTR